MNGLWRSRIIYLAGLALASILLCMVMGLLARVSWICTPAC